MPPTIRLKWLVLVLLLALAPNQRRPPTLTLIPQSQVSLIVFLLFAKILQLLIFLISHCQELEKTRVLIDHIKTCWSDAVFLPTLAHKFWSLTLQLLARYVVGIRILVPLEDTNAAGGVGSETSSPRSSVVSPDGANAPTAVPMSHSLSTASATSSVSSNVDTSSSSNNSSGSSSMLSSIAISLTALLNTHHDIELVVVKLRKIFEDDVCRLVPRTVDTRVLQGNKSQR